MGNRYWITGVQLGMLMDINYNVRVAKEIMEKQEELDAVEARGGEEGKC